jgi:hypothetical protein
VKRIAISQSNYIPWKGYFHVIGSVDEFVLYDEVQYTKRDWRNRNVIKTERGPTWLSIPVQVKGRYTQRIDETLVAESGWAASHWGKIEQSYSQASHFDTVAPVFASFYETVKRTRLSDINRDLIELVMDAFGIRTPLRWSTDFPLETLDRTNRLVSICQQANADEYWTGPAAKAYLDEATFGRAGISVHYVDYSGFAEYDQLHGEFLHQVSVLDVLFNAGPDVGNLLALGSVA